MVNSYFTIVMLLINGDNEFPTKMILTGILISIPVIFIQYPVLQIKKNWFYKILAFYLSMIVFLFIYGIAMAWNEKVGANDAGTWLARFDSGIRMIFFGHVLGGLFGMIPIVLFNYFLRKEIFYK